MTRRTLLIIGTIIALFLAVVGMLFAWQSNQSSQVSDTATYRSDTYDIAFTYPAHYELSERMVTSALRYHYNVALVERSSEAPPVDSEGPTAITVDIYQNDLDQQSVEDWIRGSSDSNYKLSPDGVLTPTEVAGTPALQYRWDGLYLGESTVFSWNENIIMVSVTYFSAEDQIRTDYETVLDSIELLTSTVDGVVVPPREEPVACTMEAKMCPDGSAVGRTGPRCEFAACPGEAVGEARIGASTTVGAFTITPRAVLEDSRCPIDVVCIQAGTVRVQADVASEGASPSLSFTLDTPVSVGMYTITLISVSPGAHSKRTIAPGDYRFTFRVQ